MMNGHHALPPHHMPQHASTAMYAYGIHQPRQRLRPWLADQINGQQVPGLEWIDKEQQIFKIPWKHFGRPGVDEYNDAMLFRNWALHTKKHVEGQPTDISTWKTRFRCALHKLPDIEELQHLNQVEGDNPYRVYQFKSRYPPDSSPASVSSPCPINVMHGASNIQDLPSSCASPASTYMSGASPAPQLTDQQYGGTGYVEDFADLTGLMDGGDMSLENLMRNGQNLAPNEYQLLNQQQQQQHAAERYVNNNNSQPCSDQAIFVKLFYKENTVGQQMVDNPQGLRIAFNPPPPLPDNYVNDSANFVSHIYGPFHADQLYFPPGPDQFTNTILNVMKRGLVIQCRKGEILATRLCRSKVYYSDSLTPADGQLQELKREHTTPVFNYQTTFLPRLKRSLEGDGAAPSCEIYFSFGQKWSSEQPLLKEMNIHVSIKHVLSSMQLSARDTHTNIVLHSAPNAYDDMAKQLEDLSINKF